MAACDEPPGDAFVPYTRLVLPRSEVGVKSFCSAGPWPVFVAVMLEDLSWAESSWLLFVSDETEEVREASSAAAVAPSGAGLCGVETLFDTEADE